MHNSRGHQCSDSPTHAGQRCACFAASSHPHPARHAQVDVLDTVGGSATYATAYTHAKANGCAPPAVTVRPGSVRCCGADGQPSAACAATASGKSARAGIPAVVLSNKMHMTCPRTKLVTKGFSPTLNIESCHPCLRMP